MKKQKTTIISNENVDRKWLVVDVNNVVLGRAATKIADLLRGKHKPLFSANTDNGDFVVVLNAEKIRLTGNKLKDKMTYHHSGFFGGIKERSAEQILEKNPTELLSNAVQGMMPKSNLAKKQLTKLKVYVGTEHPHQAQQCVVVKLA